MTSHQKNRDVVVGTKATRNLALAGFLSLDFLGGLLVLDFFLKLAGAIHLFRLALKERLGTTNASLGHVNRLCTRKPVP